MPSPSEREQADSPALPDHVGRTEGSTTPADLSATRRAFPGFRIWRETVGDRTVYVARRRQPGTRPHTLVTTDPHELRAALADTARQAAHPVSTAATCPPRSPDATR